MIVNGKSLLMEKPIVDMLDSKHKVGTITHGLAEGGYDIRIKQQISFYPAKSGFYLPVWEETDDGEAALGFTRKIAIKPTIVVMDPEDGSYTVAEDTRFTLASAIEEFDMPNRLLGIVHDKSSWARKGLSVFNTVIEPGWKGFLTLELVFHGNEPVIIPHGSGIAQVIFHQLENPSAYNGKYQNQPNEPVRAK